MTRLRDIIRKKFPITRWLPLYKLPDFFHDLIGGFTVALTEIPQSIAYASIAGLPPQYGLYSSFMGSFTYAIFGSCRVINMGATSLMSLMIQPFVTSMGIDMSPLMSFIGGFIILTLGLLNLGFVIDFFSYPVTAGFTSAAALTIASSQIKNLLGFTGKSNEFVQSWESIFENISETSKYDAILGLSTVIILIFLRDTLMGDFPHFDHLLLARISMELTTYDFLEMLAGFRASLGFIPLVAIIETIAIAKVFSKGKFLDANQEMLALGVGNILGSFFQSMPVTGSFTRTAINNASGSKTSISGVITGCTVLIALKFLTSSFYYIPNATLAAVIITAMIYLFEYEAFITLWKNKKSDLVPLFVTFLSCLFISLEYGILIGIGVNLGFVLFSIARPKFEIAKEKLRNSENVYVLAPKTAIYFPAAEYLRELVLLECDNEDGESSLIVMDGKSMGNIDATVAKSLISLSHEVELKDQSLIFLNFKSTVREVITGIDSSLEKYFQNGEIGDLKYPIKKNHQP